MNGIHMSHPLAMALTLGAAVVFAILAAVNEVCQPPAAQTLRSPTDVTASGGKPNDAPAHCLMFGKYCLGEFLRGKS
ncbi:MAG: hypothetical protein RXR20_04800 [Paraburkholderia sp.]|uniref:hypothetical protein n=1 Tax=Burkholderiaceae TaxID=119060 RepID=UPI0010F58B8D|nr:hypothetical protein [Burkholderia sp. 4M9327F10]